MFYYDADGSPRPPAAQWHLANVELLSRETATAQLFHNKLQKHPTLLLFYAFLTTAGWWWGFGAQRHKL